MQTDKMVRAGMWTEQAQAVAGGVNTGLTAAGTTQATALALVEDNNFVGTTAAGTGVILQSNLKKGDRIYVFNGGANALLVYPPVGGTIDGAAANAGLSLATLKGAMFICAGDGLTFGTVGGA